MEIYQPKNQSTLIDIALLRSLSIDYYYYYLFIYLFILSFFFLRSKYECNVTWRVFARERVSLL